MSSCLLLPSFAFCACEENLGLINRSSLLLANEQVVLSTPISVRTSASSASSLIPSFLLHATKRRQLVLTDFPRLVEVKDDKDEADKGPRVKFEAVFARPAPAGIDLTEPNPTGRGIEAGAANRVVDVHEKGSKGFVVNTVSAWLVQDECELMVSLVAVCFTRRIRRRRGIGGLRLSNALRDMSRQ